MEKMTTDHAEFEAIKQEVLKLGFVRPGSVVRRFMPCGRPSCRCMGTPPQLHGPYYQWTHKIGGKTRTIRLSDKQARLCRQWQENHKKLIRRMERISLQETERFLGAISGL